MNTEVNLANLTAGKLDGMHDLDDITRARRKMEICAEVLRAIWCLNLTAAVVGLLIRRFDAATLALVTALMGITVAGMMRRAASDLRFKDVANDQMESEVDETIAGIDHRGSRRIGAELR